SETEKCLLVVVLGLEMLMGVVGNSLVLLVKVMCSLLITSGSMLAILTGGQRSPWCEVVSLLKFAFITSSIGSIVLCVQRLMSVAFRGSVVVMVAACLASWVTGVVFGSIPVVYAWIYDPAEMLCAVFWENNYSDMLVYILCAFSICIFLPFLLVFGCSVDLSDVAPLLVASYTICYTPFIVSELILLGRMDLSPAPDWLRTLSSVMSYLDCGLNPLIYCTHQNFREAGLGLLWTKVKPVSEPVLTAITKHQL
uniref:Si:dkey-9i23.8 n=1 Tax=Stegastes partitus TaxID=144197 RepID=A0A3B4ZAZ6_9TELE